MAELRAGAAQIDITPLDSQFLFGYPHVERYSTGVHDPLYSSALAIANGAKTVIFVANDVIFVDKRLVASARERIEREIGVPVSDIMITATHTHSGPLTVDHLSNKDDPTVPKADPAYRRRLEDGIVEAAVEAVGSLTSAEIGFAIADATGIGTNRRDPQGPADLTVPVLLARSNENGASIGCMVICSMHPTVLHEDSTLVSGDFPAMARRYLRRSLLGEKCPFIYHTGSEGNQSPRHVTRGNTFEEAERLGGILGRAVERAAATATYLGELSLSSEQRFVELPKKGFPHPAGAERRLGEVLRRFHSLKESGTSAAEVRTAECDWFGAEETVTLARAVRGGEIQSYYAGCMPAEIQVIRIGRWNFVGWPGEVFIEYALELKNRYPSTFVANLANGELQGYIVTPEAMDEGGYEASNAMFDYRSGRILVDTTAEILEQISRA